LNLGAQEDQPEIEQEDKPKKIQLNGYIKNMQSVYLIDSLNPLVQDAVLLDNLVHHRLNFTYFIHPNWTLRADLRNRIFVGESMKMNPFYGELIDLGSTNSLLDREAWYSPSWLLVNRQDLVIHSTLDRFYLEFIKGNWEVRLGRQRINWGITSFWNPNDIFNAYNFTDFDYEERPGSDALRVTYYTGMLSKLEFAVQAFDAVENINAAMLWQFNKWNYDFQLMSGLSYNDVVIGGGWAGGIKNIGFKGEASFFQPLADSVDQSFTASLAFDYAFANSLFLNFGFLYNSNGLANSNISELFAFELSAKNLYPFPYSMMASVSYPFNPIFFGNLAVVYSPGTSNAMFISPSLSYSIKTNWDLDFVGQIMLGNDGQSYTSPVQLLFLRLKYSY
jgi:hypothetical protein